MASLWVQPRLFFYKKVYYKNLTVHWCMRFCCKNFFPFVLHFGGVLNFKRRDADGKVWIYDFSLSFCFNLYKNFYVGWAFDTWLIYYSFRWRQFEGTHNLHVQTLFTTKKLVKKFLFKYVLFFFFRFLLKVRYFLYSQGYLFSRRRLSRVQPRVLIILSL